MKPPSNSLKQFIFFVLSFCFIGTLFLILVAVFNEKLFNDLIYTAPITPSSPIKDKFISLQNIYMGSIISCSLFFYLKRNKLSHLKSYIKLGLLAGFFSLPLSLISYFALDPKIYSSVGDFFFAIAVSVLLSSFIYFIFPLISLIGAIIAAIPILTGLLAGLGLFYFKKKFIK